MMKWLMLVVLLLCVGCAEKNYSRSKPNAEELVGTWALSADSRSAVQAKIDSHLAATDGVLVVSPDGTVAALGLPLSRGFRLSLFNGSGRWELVGSGGIWQLVLSLSDPKTPTILIVRLDIGQDGERYLNQAIDDPDGEVMRFYRSR